MAKTPTETEDQDPDIEFDILENGNEAETADEEAPAPEADEETEDDEPAPVARATPAAPDPAILQALQDLNDRVGGIEPQVTDLNKARIDIAEGGVRDAITQVKAMRKKAMEDGDSDAFDRLDEQLAELRGRAGRIEQIKLQAAAAPVRKIPQRQPAADPEPVFAPQARTWMTKNPWFNPTGKDEASATARHFSDLVLDKFAADDPRHYEEVDKRMAKQFPKLYGAGAARPKPAAASGARRPAQAGADDTQRAAITRGTYNNFKLAGFDVNDPAVKKKMVAAVNETNARLGVKRAG